MRFSSRQRPTERTSRSPSVAEQPLAQLLVAPLGREELRVDAASPDADVRGARARASASATPRVGASTVAHWR